jgi:hypothetical protein
MRKVLLGVIVSVLLGVSVSAQTADEIINNYIKTVGGMEKMQAVKSVRKVGKFNGGGGFEAVYIEENKRPNAVRQEFSLQGMTAVNAYDGKSGWKINPFSGKKDAETLGEEEMKQIIEDSDFDGALVDYRKKGNKVEFIGKDEFEGSDVFKLKLTLANGDTRYYYMDTDYFVPIKIETKRTVRGAEQEFETIYGDYKEVAGVYFPFSVESGIKGNPNRQSITYEKIEVNTAMDDKRFAMPTMTAKPAEAQPKDASEKNQQPKKPEDSTKKPESGAKKPQR